MPSGPSTAARTPFVLLVFVLLGGGLITLLLLNSALNQGSFKLRELKDRTTELTDEEQALQRDVDVYVAPDALERRARELGMVPGGSPAFLGPDGKVLGEPSVARSPKPTPTPTPKPTAIGAPGASATPSAPGGADGPSATRPGPGRTPATTAGTLPTTGGTTKPGPTGTGRPPTTPVREPRETAPARQTDETAPTTSGR
ncbi:hypothetical protein AB0G79_08015 [Streptomyces sp. NPDC020807]|uniref:hypothetical protein n=1 Tax=Streptomyces sp. NPDC020807 TaxID=3155119 RepID=UPI0033F03780